MLGKYLKIDGLQYPNPISFSGTPEHKEKVNESEAGSDLVATKRLNKKNYAMTFQVSKYWYDRILADCSKLRVNAEIYGDQYVGRLRLATDTLEPDSVNTNGYWTIAVNFIEK